MNPLAHSFFCSFFAHRRRELLSETGVVVDDPTAVQILLDDCRFGLVSIGLPVVLDVEAGDALEVTIGRDES